MVEGGALLLRSFLEANLWDEIWVETTPLLLGEGVKAPSFSGKVCKSEWRGGHLLEIWRQ